jgi:hypothetical protein
MKHIKHLFDSSWSEARSCFVAIFFSFALKYVIRKAQKIVRKDSNCMPHNYLLLYVDGINLLIGNVNTVRKHMKVLLDSSKEVDVEVNAERMKCVFMTKS